MGCYFKFCHFQRVERTIQGRRYWKLYHGRERSLNCSLKILQGNLKNSYKPYTENCKLIAGTYPGCLTGIPVWAHKNCHSNNTFQVLFISVALQQKHIEAAINDFLMHLIISK